MNLSELRDALPEAKATLAPERHAVPMTCEIIRENGETVFKLCHSGESFKVTVPGLLNAEQCAGVVSLIVKSLTD